ncbi:hypothetical protein CONPUDRAFT_163123 [Coniophora puteana RWD-64-598 SS2]|uniref:Uncharacterized protein n=1 Tax=Coniophora puteana (strain RWD-64-598) TaxID=741705 RepID=A0A5M3MXL8_CONPW|nr:uncharacterized protein CONPUDRAFT_163123 [Coniophora puteana RWD-64-598 SS2]EIW83842.1 hypothetical protein CONPUDRAFT_163123 [Coniophora puteana RWD-64-598 SS2]
MLTTHDTPPSSSRNVASASLSGLSTFFITAPAVSSASSALNFFPSPLHTMRITVNKEDVRKATFTDDTGRVLFHCETPWKFGTRHTADHRGGDDVVVGTIDWRWPESATFTIRGMVVESKRFG